MAIYWRAIYLAIYLAIGTYIGTQCLDYYMVFPYRDISSPSPGLFLKKARFEKFFTGKF